MPTRATESCGDRLPDRTLIAQHNIDLCQVKPDPDHGQHEEGYEQRGQLRIERQFLVRTLTSRLYQSTLGAKEQASDGASDDGENQQQPDKSPQVASAGAEELFPGELPFRRVPFEDSRQAEQRHQEEQEPEVHGRHDGSHERTPFRAGDHLKVDREVEAMQEPVGEQTAIEYVMHMVAEGSSTELRQGQVEQPEPEDVALMTVYDAKTR